MSHPGSHFLILQLLLLGVLITYAARNFDINFTKVECKLYNQTVYHDFSCNMGYLLEAANRTTTNFRFTHRRAAPRLRCVVMFEAVRPGQDQNFKVLEANVSVCEFLDSVVSINVIAIYYQTMAKSINEMPKCPFKKNFTHILQNFRFNPNDFPLYTPEGSFNLKLDFIEDNRMVAYYQAGIEVVFKRKVWMQSAKKPRGISQSAVRNANDRN